MVINKIYVNFLQQMEAFTREKSSIPKIFWGGISTWPESRFVVVVSVFVLFSMSPPSSWSIAEISSGKVSTLDLKNTDDTDASVQRTSIAKLHNP